MGMSASQARFLSLTARKTNVEYEGQQINQQRTTLSNESANYYSQLTQMTVPTPPSTQDYTKITYTFEDGVEKNTITSLIAKPQGEYIVSYNQTVLTDTMVSNGNVIVTKNDEGYFIGSTKLRELGTDSATDPYLSTIKDPEERKKALELEKTYSEMLKNKYGEEDWLVRYQLNTTNNTYTPVFYSKKQIENADYTENGTSLSSIKSYIYGQANESKEVKNANARLEQDTSGRYISISIQNADNTWTEYKLTSTTTTDDNAYNDAMNQYNYNKTMYDKKIQDINAKIKIIHGQDKNLELRLKQLDTEENAITNEMDAVKKVITKNVESSFKTFNA